MIAGVIAIGLLSIVVCLMWAYAAIQAEKERKNEMNKTIFWFAEMQKPQRCNACGKEIKEGRSAIVFRNTEAKNIGNLSRVRLCTECGIRLLTLLEKGKVL